MALPRKYRVALVGASETAIVADELQSAFLRHDYDVEILNRAISGTTIAEYWNPSLRHIAMQRWQPISERELAQSDMIWMCYGSNDLLSKPGKQTIAMVEAETNKMLDRCKEAGTPVVLVGITEAGLNNLKKTGNFPPGYGAAVEAMHERLSHHPAVVKFYRSMYDGLNADMFLAKDMDKPITATNPLERAHQWLKNTGASNLTEVALADADHTKKRRGVHPNQEAQNILAERFSRFIEPVIDGLAKCQYSPEGAYPPTPSCMIAALKQQRQYGGR